MSLLLDLAKALHIMVMAASLLSPFIALYMLRKGTVLGDEVRKAFRKERKKYWQRKK